MRSYRIGRGRGNDIIVKDASVSRRHAELRITEAGEYVLVDLESTNGTCVREDGHWIEIRQASVAKTERILLGEVITSVSALVDKAIRAQTPFAPAEDMARRIRTEPMLPAASAPAEPRGAEAAAAPVAGRADPDFGSPRTAWPSSRRMENARDPSPRAEAPVSSERAQERATPAAGSALSPGEPVSPVSAAASPGRPERREKKRKGRRGWLGFLALVLILGAGAAYGYMKFRDVVAGDGQPASAENTAGEELLASEQGQEDRAARETPGGDEPERGTTDAAAAELPRPSMSEASDSDTWQQVLSGPGRHTYHSAVPGSGGVFAAGSIAAAAQGADETERRLWVTRFGARGELLWQRVYGGEAAAAAASVYPMDDRGALVAGHRVTGDGRRVPWVLRLDSEGDILWQRTLGNLYSGVATYVTGIPGGYVVASAINRQEDGPVATRLVKIDDNGRVLWSRTFDDGLTWPTGLRRARDGGVVVAGVNKSRPEDIYVLWAARVDNDGTARWANRYARGGGEDGTALVRRAAGDEYIIAATHTRRDGEQRSVDLRIVRLSPDGRVIWRHLHETPAPERAAGLILVPDGIVVAGSTENDAVGGRDLLIIQFDTSGRVVWRRRYGGGRHDWATDLRQTNGRGLLISGISESHGQGRDGWILRLDSQGRLAN